MKFNLLHVHKIKNNYQKNFIHKTEIIIITILSYYKSKFEVTFEFL